MVHPPGRAPYLADAAGRMMLLRGVDSNALVQYSGRTGCSFQEQVPLTRADLVEMAALGFGFLRLAVSWSRIEPAPGVFSASYLAQIAHVVRWARDNGIAVVVDMHQDRYNRRLWCGQEVDGAPDWATLTLGAPCTPIELTTVCAQAAAQAFWSDMPVDGVGLQQWYLGALKAIAGSVGDSANLAGIELMNEPTPGVVAPGTFETTELYPFYRVAIAGLRHAGYAKPIWFEPSVFRDETDNAMATAVRFSTDPQLVYAVHIYTGVFSEPAGPNNTEAQLNQSYVAASEEAAVFGTPWVDDEFGSNASAAWDQWIGRELTLQDRYVVGSGFWLWKQQPGFYGWSVVHPNGTLRTSTERAQLLSLPHVDSVPGRLLATHLVGTPNAGGSASPPSSPSPPSLAAPGGAGGPTSGPELVSTVASARGGTAVFWAGTVVGSGGTTVLSSPLDAVTIDGTPVHATCWTVSFSTESSTSSESQTALHGCLLSVPVPSGRHTITLSEPSPVP
ncbi:MAG: glycoside hydrolase family 5 protein [Acidimicrobiales bacterium]